MGGSCGDCRSSAFQKNKPPLKQNLNEAERELVDQKLDAIMLTTPAATAFTSLAWVIVALTFICTLIATFATAADGDAFLAMIMFISGCFSAVLLGLLTEISANIAKLVNNSR